MDLEKAMIMMFSSEIHRDTMLPECRAQLRRTFTESISSPVLPHPPLSDSVNRKMMQKITVVI